MNECIEQSLYDILDNLNDRLVQLYYISCWELDDREGMRVSQTILHVRGLNYDSV